MREREWGELGGDVGGEGEHKPREGAQHQENPRSTFTTQGGRNFP
jgi:hypothetical protein